MNQTKVDFGRPWITDDEREAVLEVLNGPILTHGPQCKMFEDEFAAFLGDGAHCVTVSSCMAALHLAYFEMGIGAGDEVIVPAMTHTATAHAVELVGARAVFVDAEPVTGNVDVDQIESKITSNTRAISLVHFLGVLADMSGILEIAERHGLRVIEDCALAVGTRVRGRHAGLFGDVGTFSFYPVKHMTTGEGGMFVSRRPEIAARAAKLRAFGVDRTHTQRTVPGMYDVQMLGLNYRMSEMQAAIGRRQIHKMPEILERRTANFRALHAGLAELPGIRVLGKECADRQNSYYCLTTVLEQNGVARREAVVRSLNDAGVGTSIYYPQPVPRMTYYRNKYGYDAGQFPVAEQISDASIALPVGPHLTTADMNYIADQFARALEESNT